MKPYSTINTLANSEPPRNAVWIACVVVAYLITAASLLAQDTYWQDDFEGYVAGVAAPSPWVASGGGDVISTSQHYAGLKSLELDGSAGGCYSALCFRPVPAGTCLYIEFAIRPSSNHKQGCHPWVGASSLGTTADWSTWQSRNLFVLDYANRAILAGDGTTVLSTWNYDQWRKLGVLYKNNGTKISLTYFLDGTRRGPLYFDVLSYENSLRYFEVESGDGTTWIDNVRPLKKAV